jgi:hypothetical protein
VTPGHYAVPDGMDIRLIGYVRRDHDNFGHYITTLWRNQAGQFFYYEDFWTPYTPPFWLGASLTDLTPCNASEFCDHVDAVCASITDPEEYTSVYIRYAELMTVWGILEGVDRGFAWKRENPHKH